MAEVQDIYGNNITGKVGPVSFYRSRGKTIMRSRPGKRTRHSSDKQLVNQGRFKEMRLFCTKFKERVIPQIWNGVATTSSGYHLFMKANSPAFDKEGMLADPVKIQLSAGKLTLPPGLQAQRTSPGATTIQVKWEKATLPTGLSAKDQLLVISASDGNYSDITVTGLKRSGLGGSFELPALASPATHIYLFFESLDQRYYSDSVCLEI